MKNDLVKYKLIYQFNNNSPLFARIAEDHMKNAQFDKAAEILENGLKIYPDYVSANLLYALCLTHLEKSDEAKSFIENAANILDSEETKTFYLNKIISSNQTEPELIIEQTNDFESLAIDEESKDESKESPEDDLEQLVQKLEGAKINFDPKDDFENNNDDVLAEGNESGKSLVSETLAKIYLNQGNYSEALNLYKNLMEIQPERAQFYSSQINYIQKIIEAEKK